MNDKTEFSTLANIFGLEAKDLYLLTRNPSIFYCDYQIPKRSGGIRNISSPSLKLMTIQREILNQILKPNFKCLQCCTGFVENKSIIDNVLPHCKRDYILKTDLKDFFPSIKKEMVENLFKSLGYSSKISSLLSSLCCRFGCIPQGAPTSPIISNIIMKDTDLKILDLCEKKELIYTRYADDITISSKTPIDETLLCELSKILYNIGMKINPTKTHLYGPKSKKIITGISISSGELKLPRKTKRLWRQEINMIKKFGLLNHMENTKQMNPLFIPSLKGKLAFWHQIEPENSFIDKAFLILDEAIERLDI